jgi:hypothetical protein
MRDDEDAAYSRISGGRMHRLRANRIDASQAAVGSVESEVARLERAAVRRLHATRAHVERSAVGVLSIGQGTLQKSTAGVVMAKSLAADEVRVGVLIAPVVRGEVHTLFDMRSAVAVGVGIALGRSVLRLLSRR